VAISGNYSKWSHLSGTYAPKAWRHSNALTLAHNCLLRTRVIVGLATRLVIFTPALMTLEVTRSGDWLKSASFAAVNRGHQKPFWGYWFLLPTHSMMVTRSWGTRHDWWTARRNGKWDCRERPLFSGNSERLHPACGDCGRIAFVRCPQSPAALAAQAPHCRHDTRRRHGCCRRRVGLRTYSSVEPGSRFCAGNRPCNVSAIDDSEGAGAGETQRFTASCAISNYSVPGRIIARSCDGASNSTSSSSPTSGIVMIQRVSPMDIVRRGPPSTTSTVSMMNGQSSAINMGLPSSTRRTRTRPGVPRRKMRCLFVAPHHDRAYRNYENH
jgi:hypothetical protein